MRYETFAPNEYYHVFVRGVNREKIFLDDRDRARFVFLITHLQSPTKVNNIGWYTTAFLKTGTLPTKPEKARELLKERSIELVAFALMPNHFHLAVRNLEDGVLSVYMHRLLTAYGKYFNAKYHKKGHVFEGPFGATLVKNNTQLLHLSAYIHKNPTSIKAWEKDYADYPWSSYQDYLGQNRWGEFLHPNIVLKQFKNGAGYRDFVASSTAKDPTY